MSATNLISAKEAISLTNAGSEKFKDQEEGILASINKKIRAAAAEGVNQIFLRGKTMSRFALCPLFAMNTDVLLTKNVKASLIAEGYRVDATKISPMDNDNGSYDVTMVISWC